MQHGIRTGARYVRNFTCSTWELNDSEITVLLPGIQIIPKGWNDQEQRSYRL